MAWINAALILLPYGADALDPGNPYRDSRRQGGFVTFGGPAVLDLVARAAPGAVYSRFGTYLLPMAYPEGSPTHPSYPAGHATISGACATVLKAFFDESFVIPDPKVAGRGGLALGDWTGVPLTLGGELNKLASNCTLARDTAGVHYRQDGVQGLLLGEQVGLALLREFRALYPEPFDGFRLTTFGGKSITV